MSVNNASSAEVSGFNSTDALALSANNASSVEVRTVGALMGSVTSASSLRYAGTPSAVSVSCDVSSSVSPL
ncbi:MAG: hypothetical protein JXD23_09175 [Spirochaetales bacterium]|nr:hypothetical protein [Spirochaetales bacterium]